jgi:sugar (pentulose or hexulose) kinase
LMDWEDIPKKVRFAKVYEPRPENKEIYDRLFAQFQASFKGLRPVYHALHE